jgi:hypothetical protein
MFPHSNIHKYAWTSPDGKTHNEIDHILVDRRRHSNILDARSYRAADCDTDHYLVVARVKERLRVNKQRSHRFHMERLNVKKFADLEYLDAEVEMNSGGELTRENIQISVKERVGYFELKKHKPWFGEGCS